MTALKEIQLAFTNHLRDPENYPAPSDLEERRLKIYRELFFNNVLNFLESGFPVIHSLYSEEDWQSLGRAFFASHSCRSPFFVDISKEFVEFLGSEYQSRPSDPIFLQELAHYEWIELALSIRAQESEIQPWTCAHKPVAVQFSELAELLSYQFPVHQISPEFRPIEVPDSPTYLVVNRTVQDQVQFTEINAVTAHLLNAVVQVDIISLDELVEQMCAALPHLSAEQVSSGALQAIMQMLEKQVLLPAEESTAN